MPTLFEMQAQADMEFPAPLTEKYRPTKIREFVGLSVPKSVLRGLLGNPRPCALLFAGPPGSGKTSMAMAFASELRAGLIHHASAKMTVDAVNQTMERVQYYPPSGGYWVVLVDEAERMSPQAQAALLSPLDSTATLRPKFGGGFESCPPLKVIWIFTCNGKGETQTEPPDGFEPRFLRRCLKLGFQHPPHRSDLAFFLADIWCRENRAKAETPLLRLGQIVDSVNGCVADALQSLELELLVRG